MDTHDHQALSAPRLLLGLAASMWLAAMVLPLTAHGAGSSLPGHELADLASSGRLPDGHRWLGPAWYLMPLGGAVVLVSLGLSGTLAGAVRWAAATVATASAVIFTVLVTDLDVDRFGTGAWAGIAGSGLAVSAVCLAVLRQMRDRRHEHVLQ